MKKLAFDFGAYNGKDTLFLCQHNYTVISVDANKSMISKLLKQKYLYNLDNQIIHAAIADIPNQQINFYVSNHRPWSSCNRDIAERIQPANTYYKVRTTTTKKLIEKYGCPDYLKVDIEGNDILALLSINDTKYRPKYISCESECQTSIYDKKKNYAILNCMQELGYTKFFIAPQQKDEITFIPDEIQKWISYDDAKLFLHNEIQKSKQKYNNVWSFWADIYCTNYN